MQALRAGTPTVSRETCAWGCIRRLHSFDSIVVIGILAEQYVALVGLVAAARDNLFCVQVLRSCAGVVAAGPHMAFYFVMWFHVKHEQMPLRSVISLFVLGTFWGPWQHQ